MSPRGSKRVSFSPDPEAKEEPIHPTDHTGLSSSRHGRRRIVSGGVFSFSVKSSPTARRILRRIGAGVVKTFRFMSLSSSRSNTKSMPSTSSTSSLSCSSSSTIYMAKSRSVNESESHRAEDIEDCIEFLHSSSSLDRSNSTFSAWSC